MSKVLTIGKWFLIGSLFIVGFGGLIAYLIIWITPRLYPMHPLVNQASNASVAEKSVTVTDTILIVNDSTIVHSSVIDNTSFRESESNAPSIGDLGTFGDSAGFWNAIFSALAFGAVIATFAYQHKKDREDDEKARLAQFQSQCMTMMSMLSEIVSQLRISEKDTPSVEITPSSFQSTGWLVGSNNPIEDAKPGEKGTIQEDIVGRACFKYIYSQRPGNKSICGYIAVTYRADDNPDIDIYRGVRKVMENHFDHYFRTLYRILKFIKESDLGRCDKKKQEETRDLCADLVRAQLSTFELAVLYYNGLYPDFNNTSKLLYEHFCIFDNLDPRILQLKSEKDYYTYVRQNHRNHREKFNKTTHYDFTAFTKANMDDGRNLKIMGRIKRWLQKCILRVRRRFRKKSARIVGNSGLSEDAIKLFNILFHENERNITNRWLVNKAHTTEENLRTTLSELKREGYVSWSNAKTGKRYKILKDL